MPTFGQIVIGPPGSGKSTYCLGMMEFLTGLGRKVAVVNLDPANENLPYDCKINVSTLISLSDVMDSLSLGPNGALLYCMEYLEKNIDWLQKELKKLEDFYILFDCPGQVELYTHHNSIRSIVKTLETWQYRLAAVHLVDSHYCSDPGKFISVLLTSLHTMLKVELPHINVLSKIDLIEQYGKLSYNLEYFTEVMDLSYLVEQLKDDCFTKKYKKLNDVLVGLVQDYSLVSFVTLNIQDKESLLNVMKAVDKANGYVFGAKYEDNNMSALMSSAVGADFEFFKSASVQERYMTQDT